MNDWSAAAEMLLHFAARAEHVAKTIRPALAAGMIVVCDRFFDSTMAYQGFGQGADKAQIAVLTGLLGILPELTLILDVPEGIAQQRLAMRGLAPDRYDRLGSGFHARVAAGFRAIAAAAPGRCCLLDASGAADDVFTRLLSTVIPGLETGIQAVPRVTPRRIGHAIEPNRRGSECRSRVDGRIKSGHDV